MDIPNDLPLAVRCGRSARRDLIQALYVQITANLEDAAAIAVDGQGCQDATTAIKIACKLTRLTEDVQALIRTISVMLSLSPYTH